MLHHADNFSIYGTSTGLMLNGIYAQVQGVLPADPDGVSSGRVWRCTQAAGANTRGLRYVLQSAAQDVVGIAMRVWLPSLSIDGYRILMQWRNAGNSPIASLTVDTTGRLTIRSGDHSGGGLETTVAPVLTATGWYHVEAMIDVVNDAWEVRVEGQTVLQDSSGGAFGSSVAQVFTGLRTTAGGSGSSYDVKDFVVWDDQGTYNNTFLGSVLVHSLIPTADVDLNWTPSTGSDGWSILDNIPPNDAQYISAPYDSGGPPYYPDPYVCELSDLPIEATSVKGVISFVRAAKSDGGDGSLQVGIISDPNGSPATALGADRPITIAQTYWRDVFEEDPVTTAPWLPQAVNAAQLQIDRTT